MDWSGSDSGPDTDSEVTLKTPARRGVTYSSCSLQVGGGRSPVVHPSPPLSRSLPRHPSLLITHLRSVRGHWTKDYITSRSLTTDHSTTHHLCSLLGIALGGRLKWCVYMHASNRREQGWGERAGVEVEGELTRRRERERERKAIEDVQEAIT